MSDRADQRQGVCIGLGEILASTSREAVLSFADGLVNYPQFVLLTNMQAADKNHTLLLYIRI